MRLCLEGDLYWHGDIEPLETKKIQAKVKVAKEGLWTVTGVSMQAWVYNGSYSTITPPVDEVFLDVKKDKTTMHRQIKPSTPSDLQLGAITTGKRAGENRTTPPPTSPPPYKETSLPYLQFGATPQVNKTVPLSFVLIPSRDVEGVDVDVLLPDGLEYVSGDISFKGDIKKYQKVEITSLVKVKRDGDYVVRGVIKNTSSGGLMQGTTFIPSGFNYGTDNLFFTVSGEDVIFQRYHFRNKDFRSIPPIKDDPAIKEGIIKFEKPKLKKPLELNLSLGGEPLLMRGVPLITEITALEDFPKTRVSIHLPRGFELVSGDLKWSGNLKAGEIKRIETIVRSVEPGKWRIRASANKARDSLTVWITNESAIIEPLLPANIKNLNATEIVELTKLDSKSSTSVLSTQKNPALENQSIISSSAVTAAATTIDVTGYITWYNETTETIIKPLRYARVKLYDDEVGPNEFIAENFTNEDGYYEFLNVDNDDGPFQGGLDLYIEYYLDGEISGNGVVDVGPFFSSAIYWADTKDGLRYNVSGNEEINSVVRYSSADEVNPYERIIDGHKYLKDNLGYIQPKVDVNYPYSSSYTYINRSSSVWNWLVLSSGDAWDRDVILHEYSHNVQLSVYDLLHVYEGIWPAGAEEILECTSHGFTKVTSPQCAYIEGWATFLGVAINNYYNPGDTRYDDDSFYWENENWLQRGHPLYPALEDDADQNEGEVVGILWDIFDQANEGQWDSINREMSKIWSIFYNDNPWSINEFWEDWMSRGHGQDQKLWAIYYNHGINKDTTPPPPPTLQSPINNQKVRWDTNNLYLTFDWEDAQDDLSGISKYRILVDDDINFGSPEINTTTTTSQSSVYYYDYELPDGPYFWQVQTIDNAGNEGGFSLPESFVIDNSCVDTAGPNTPSISSPSDGATITVETYTVNWGDVTDNGCAGMKGYEVKETKSGGSTKTYPTGLTSELDFSKSPSDNGNYTYWVRGVDNFDNPGSWSGAVSITGEFK